MPYEEAADPMRVTCHGKDWQPRWITGNGSPGRASGTTI